VKIESRPFRRCLCHVCYQRPDIQRALGALYRILRDVAGQFVEHVQEFVVAGESQVGAVRGRARASLLADRVG
jgi:hypothetical protein